MILQFSQIFLTDARTFMTSSRLPDAASLYLYRYTIRPRVRSYGDSSTVTLSPGRILMKCIRILPEMCASTDVPVLELHPEHRVRERLDHRALDLDAFFFRHALNPQSSDRGADRISGPCPPTATVCSKCADSVPSRVTTVQPSGRRHDLVPPRR